MPPPIELRIEKLVYGGDGLGRLDAPGVTFGDAPDSRRQAVFVPFTLPGERVGIALDPPARGRAMARLLEVIEPSPERIAPGCEYFGRCGGCQLQHTGAAHQLDRKRGILLETLQRTGKVEWPGPVFLHAAEPWGYRNRIRLRPAATGGVGYYERASHRVLPVDHCPIASPRLNRVLAELAAAPPPSGSEIELAVGNDDELPAAGAPLEYQVAGYRYRVSSGSFFQVNRFLVGELVEAVVGGVGGQSALDLFSGVGLFALPLARKFAHVQAVESHPPAAADLKHNAAAQAGVGISQLPALEYMRRRPRPEAGSVGIDLLVADPPRTGLGRDLAEAILEHAPARIHLVSCDPATLGRDLAILLAGGYDLAELHLFDLFPQTYHLETVVKLRRRAGRVGAHGDAGPACA